MSDVDLANRALVAIGSRVKIVSLDQDTDEAQTIKLVFDTVKAQVLSAAFWNFARKTALLTLLKSAPGTPTNPTGATSWTTDYPAPPWFYEYAYPADCAQMRYVIPQPGVYEAGIPIFSTPTYTFDGFLGAPPQKFIVSTDIVSSTQRNVILTNAALAIGVYTANITDTSLWSSTAQQAFVSALAGFIAVSLTGDKNLAAMLFQLANTDILSARAQDGNEGYTVQDVMPDWILARGGDYLIGSGYYVAPYPPLFAVS